MPKEKEERNKEVVREVWEKFYNQGDVNAFLRNVSDNYTWKSDTLWPFPGEIRGKMEAIRCTARISDLLPGIYGDIVSITAEDNVVSLISSTTATMSNGFLGLPQVNRPMKFHQAAFHVLTEDGKITEQWFFYDRIYILQQLGILPEVSIFGGPEAERWSDHLKDDILFRTSTGTMRQVFHTAASLSSWMAKLTLFPLKVLGASCRPFKAPDSDSTPYRTQSNGDLP